MQEAKWATPEHRDRGEASSPQSERRKTGPKMRARGDTRQGRGEGVGLHHSLIIWFYLFLLVFLSHLSLPHLLPLSLVFKWAFILSYLVVAENTLVLLGSVTWCPHFNTQSYCTIIAILGRSECPCYKENKSAHRLVMSTTAQWVTLLRE